MEHWLREAEAWQFWCGIGFLVVAALYGLMHFVRCAHAARLLRDAPVASIRSAAQGYVRLQGRARALAGEPIVAPLSGRTCVWYSFVVEQRQRDDEHDGFFGAWESREAGSSDGIFGLDDATGLCVVDPDGAEITPAKVAKWRGISPRPGFAPKATGRWNLLFGRGIYRYTETRIDDGDLLGAMGQFETLAADGDLDSDDEVRLTLSRWKRDRLMLLRRFDANRDGTVDFAEWELAQRAAEREVCDGRHRVPEIGPVNLVRRPRDGKPFYIYARAADGMIKRHRGGALVGAGLFLSALMTASFALYARFGAT